MIGLKNCSFLLWKFPLSMSVNKLFSYIFLSEKCDFLGCYWRHKSKIFYRFCIKWSSPTINVILFQMYVYIYIDYIKRQEISNWSDQYIVFFSESILLSFEISIRLSATFMGEMWCSLLLFKLEVRFFWNSYLSLYSAFFWPSVMLIDSLVLVFLQFKA